MPSMKGYLGDILPMIAMAEALNVSMYSSDVPTNDLKPEDIDVTPKKRIIPKGCKEYVFNEPFGTLKVVAMNEKTALKKYNKWCAKNSSGTLY